MPHGEPAHLTMSARVQLKLERRDRDAAPVAVMPPRSCSTGDALLII
ncbi:MAG TPA: hypothetical protein VMG35_25090 [Bryobacteraceae bacterium]|nr:hypothetical protein [Bryobacteraceae bacterium]